ncbi:hypothetical protein ACOMHN_009200 [Nucella lapillus]
MSQLFSHSVRRWRSCCSWAWSFTLVTTLYTAVSSANRRASAVSLSGRSLMYAKNSVSPSTEPCSTPERTLPNEEQLPFTTTA